ncbi:MAG: SIMPL domain-containing protein, partial [Anaerolineae bacterium]|nr:SIMPL domain-containing protein [Anaerolineae bacterium]
MSLSSVSRWKSLGIVGVVMLAAAAVLIVPAAAAPNYQMGGSIENSLTVTGSGEASGTPDVGYISLGVDITDANPGVAVSKGNEQMNTLSAAISALGIDAKDIQTTSFNVWPEDRYNPQTGNPTGERVYHVQNTLSITVRDISQIGAVIDTG